MGLKARGSVGKHIRGLEETGGFGLCADFRRFLEEVDGPGGCPEDGLNADTELVDWSAADGASSLAGDALAQVARIYGLGWLRGWFRRAAQQRGNWQFWHLHLLPHAYPVGRTYAGDPIVQVCRGTYAGQVFVTNHTVK